MAMVVGTRAAALVVVAVVALHCCGRCACAPGRPLVMRRAIVEMMKRDATYADVLAEHVMMRDGGADGAPAGARAELLPRDAADDQAVDALTVLPRLVTADGRQSGRGLTLAAAVLGAAVRCVVYKRVAVNVSLLARASGLGAADADLMTRVDALDQLLIRAADMLWALGAGCDELIALLVRTKEHRRPESFGRDLLTAALNDGAAALNATVAATCKATDTAEYVARLGGRTTAAAAAAAAPGEDAPPAEDASVDSASLDTVVRLLKAGENAVLDEFERMYMLRTADVAVWKKLFGLEDLPYEGGRGPIERAATAKYRDAIVAQMDRTAKTDELKRRRAERAAAAAAASSAAGAVGYDERAIPTAIS